MLPDVREDIKIERRAPIKAADAQRRLSKFVRRIRSLTKPHSADPIMLQQVLDQLAQ